MTRTQCAPSRRRAPAGPAAGPATTLSVEMDDEEVPTPNLEQEAIIKVVVSCRRSPSGAKVGPAEQSDSEEDSDQVGSRPTLEELDYRFVLTIFGGTTEDSNESGQLTFQAKDDTQSDENGSQGEIVGGDLIADYWSHSFTSNLTVNQETVVRICRSADSSVALQKAGLDIPPILLPIDLAPLVAGDKKIELIASLASTELVRKPYCIPEFTVSITLEGEFLTPALKAALNPLCITVVAAEDLPDIPKYEKLGTWSEGANPRVLSLSELRESCRPAFCTYCFMPALKKDAPADIEGGVDTEEEQISDWSIPVKTDGMPQARVIRFKHKKVFLTGLIHPTDLIQHLKTVPLEIELHDRDRHPPRFVLDADGVQDESSRLPPIWSGLKTTDASRAAEALPQNPCAVCHVNLAPLCDGRKFLVERCNLRPKKFKYPDFSAHQKPTPGDYVNAGSILIVKADLCLPLKLTREDCGPFRRVVLCIRYSNSDALQRLNSSIIRINAEFLGNLRSKPSNGELAEEEHPTPEGTEGESKNQPSGVPIKNPVSAFQHDAMHSMLEEGAEIERLEKGLSTIELTPEECRDPALDIITGVQVMDNSNRIFILEGLSGGITRLLEENPRAARNTKEYKMLYHPDITFTSRLYGAFHVVVKKIRLRENLKQLLANVTTYLEPKYALTAWAIIRLHEIIRAGRMRALRDLVLFPLVEQLNHMEKKLGDALSIEDITGKKTDNTKQDKSSMEEAPRLSTEELAKAVLMPRPKHKAPTDCDNAVYLQYLASKRTKDFVKEYIDLRPRANQTQEAVAETEFGEVYNYGGQSLQYTGLQRSFQQAKYMSDYGKIHWTYSKDLLSGALVLIDLEQKAKDEKRENKELWLTKEGFQWPKVSLPKEMKSLEKKQNMLGKSLTDYTVAENRLEWVENQWNPINKGYEKPELTDGRKDFNVRYNTSLKLFEQDPVALKSVFSVESGAALEAQQRKQETHQSWSKAMVVESKNFHVLWNSGKGQTDRLRPLLKNKPASVALKTMPHAEGCHPGTENPPSIFTKDHYLDPLRTYVVKSYGASLRVEPGSQDDPTSKVMKWNKDLATGVLKAEVMSTVHSKAFTASGNKPKESQKHNEKLHIRPIKPLGQTLEDRPAKLYPHTYQRQVLDT